jgi:GGDEF domain-containing protein
MADPATLLREELRLLKAARSGGGDVVNQALRLVVLARTLDDISWALVQDEFESDKSQPLTALGLDMAHRRLLAEIDRARHCSVPLTLAVLQLDAQDTEDVHGATLCAVAGEMLRSFDLVAQLDGGRVLVAFSGTSLTAAERLVGGILRKIRQTLAEGREDAETACLCSAGLVGFGGCLDITPRQLIERAEHALDLARERGGNRLEVGAPIDVLAAPRETLVHACEKHFLFTGKRMPEK